MKKSILVTAACCAVMSAPLAFAGTIVAKLDYNLFSQSTTGCATQSTLKAQPVAGAKNTCQPPNTIQVNPGLVVQINCPGGINPSCSAELPSMVSPVTLSLQRTEFNGGSLLAVYSGSWGSTSFISNFLANHKQGVSGTGSISFPYQGPACTVGTLVNGNVLTYQVTGSASGGLNGAACTLNVT